jgi:hypothetical protein
MLVQAEKRGAIEFEGETAMDLYMTLGPLARSLKALSSSKALGRLHGLVLEVTAHAI